VVIAVPPTYEAPPTANQSTEISDSIAQMLAGEVAMANSPDAVPGGNQMANGELPIDSTLTIKQLERLLSLQTIGDAIVQARLTALARVRGEVMAAADLSWDERWGTVAALDNASAGLQHLQVNLARELLPDLARADVKRIASFHVNGLLIPQAHLLVAAYQQLSHANRYASQAAGLQQRLYGAPLTNCNIGAAQAAINDLGSMSNNMYGAGYAALAYLQGLSPAGYPGNKYAILAARKDVVVSQYAGYQASNDVATAQNILKSCGV
jgi:hypothetical protein